MNGPQITTVALKAVTEELLGPVERLGPVVQSYLDRISDALADILDGCWPASGRAISHGGRPKFAALKSSLEQLPADDPLRGYNGPLYRVQTTAPAVAAHGLASLPDASAVRVRIHSWGNGYAVALHTTGDPPILVEMDKVLKTSGAREVVAVTGRVRSLLNACSNAAVNKNIGWPSVGPAREANIRELSRRVTARLEELSGMHDEGSTAERRVLADFIQTVKKSDPQHWLAPSVILDDPANPVAKLLLRTTQDDPPLHLSVQSRRRGHDIIDGEFAVLTT